jgi:hypothetical protein
VTPGVERRRPSRIARHEASYGVKARFAPDVDVTGAACVAYYLLAQVARHAVQDGNLPMARTLARGTRRLLAAFGERGAR